MRLQRRCCTTIVLLSICMLCVFVLRSSNRGRKKSAVTIDPNTKKHWFRIKIAENKLPNRRPKVILLWTKFFGQKDFIPRLESMNSPVSDCIITSNRSYFLLSDALVFHLRDIALTDMPTIKPSYQNWVLLHHESPSNTPDILRYLGGCFNWTATYRFDSDITLTPTFKKTSYEPKHVRNTVTNKTRMIAWLVSNCQTHSNREGYVKELQKSIPVDIYGDCGTRKCLPKMSEECYENIAANYYYYLAFENSICKDYVTEKFFNVLDYDMVPVVMGGANYSQVAPPGSFIDALSFHSPRALAQFLMAVVKNKAKYNSYMQWKGHYKLSGKHYACQICEKLHEASKSKWYDDIHKWWFGSDKCKSWNLSNQHRL